MNSKTKLLGGAKQLEILSDESKNPCVQSPTWVSSIKATQTRLKALWQIKMQFAENKAPMSTTKLDSAKKKKKKKNLSCETNALLVLRDLITQFPAKALC